MSERYKQFIVVVLLLLPLSCKGPAEDADVNQTIGTFHPGLVESPRTIKILKDSLLKVPAKGITIPLQANQNNIALTIHIPQINNKIAGNSEKKVSSKPVLAELSKSAINIPGTGGFQLPEKYYIPDTGSYKLKNGQMLFSRLVIKKRAGESTRALLPTFKENASYNIRYFDKASGMKSATVLSLLEDSRGFMWLGTLQGVVRYDGSSFVNFSTENGLVNNVISSIFEDSKGNIWLGSSGGVACFDGTSFTHYTTAQGLSHNEITAIAEGKDERMWIGTRDGVNCIHGDTIKQFTASQGLCGNEISAIITGKDGNIWIATSKGLSCYTGKGFINLTKTSEFEVNSVSALKQDKNGKIWFGSWDGGLYCYSGGSVTKYGSDWGLDNIIILSIAEDDNGNLWFGTFGDGVICFDGKTYSHLTVAQGLSNNSVNSIIVDETGSLWFGTLDGVSIYQESSFINYTGIKSLPASSVLSINEDIDNHLWFGTSTGIYCFDGNSFVPIKTEIETGDVSSLLKDRNGNIWLGTEAGLYFLKESSLTKFNHNQGLINDWVSGVIEDSKGRIWVATWGGVSCFDGNSFTNYTMKEGLANNSVSSILEDKKGRIWMATMGGGISCFDGKSFTNYSTANGLPGNKITSVLEDSLGHIWVGTYGEGLCRIDNDKILQFTTDQGLCNDFVESLMFDKDYNLWIGTQDGLSCLKMKSPTSYALRKSNRQKYTFFNFGVEDGLKSAQFGLNTVYLDKQNRIWWGVANGVIMIDLNKFNFPAHRPVLHLNSLEIMQQKIDYNEQNDVDIDEENTVKALASMIRRNTSYSSVAKFSNYPLGLELPYNLNHLSFHFSAIDWQAPAKLLYQYKIDGIDEYWSPPSADKIADYKNIPGGHYTLKIRAIGGAKVWSDVFEYRFYIQPPWWSTWWARILYFLVSLFLVGLYVRQRVKSLKKSKKMLELKVSQRTATIEAQKMELLEQNEEIMAQRDLLAKQKDALSESIEYAKHIQTAVMPRQEYIDDLLPDNFILFRPRDVVSGDFYWVRKIRNYIAFAVVDCTGHGVPGAFMSMLGISFLNEIVHQREITRASQVLNVLREYIKDALQQKGEIGEADDGMDLSFCVLDTETYQLQYAGANNSLYLITNGEFREIKADKMPIGYYLGEKKSFTNHEIQLTKGDALYLFSDGYMDQFGGKMGLKFRAPDFQQLIIENHKKPMTIQHGIYEQALLDWMKGYEQTDDILVMGVRV